MEGIIIVQSVRHPLSQPEPQMAQTRALRQIEAKNQSRFQSKLDFKTWNRSIFKIKKKLKTLMSI